MLRATMDISARSISLADRPRLGQTGHQCSIAPRRPVSISSLPLADLGGEGVACLAPTLSATPLIVSSLVRAEGRSFLPACTIDMRRAQARSRPARQGRSQSLALTGPSTATMIQVDWDAASVSFLVTSKPRPLASTAQAMRASLLARAIARTLWCDVGPAPGYFVNMAMSGK